MKIVLISGSHRKVSQSQKVAQFACKMLTQNDSNVQAEVLSLAEINLPMWDEDVLQNAPRWKEKFGPVSQKLTAADGIVVVSPEWAGMVPPALKNLFLLCSNDELTHKPGLIVGVSAGKGGSYPVAELRMSSYKNNHIAYMPEHIIVRDVEHVLNSDTAQSPDDTMLRERFDYALRLLKSYALALGPVREKHSGEFKKFPFGM